MATRHRTLIGMLVLALTTATLVAQEPSKPAAPPQEVDESVNVDRLPLDLARLERRLQQSAERQDWDGFRLRYAVEVYGKAPRLQFFEPKDVLPSGPIPYGAPTHQEMLEVMTPKEYRAPMMDFSALMRWLNEKLK